MTITKPMIAAALAALAIAVPPGVAAAGGLPDPDSPNCRGQAVSYGLTIARAAGNHGLGNTVGGPGLDSVHDLQQIITDYCSD